MKMLGKQTLKLVTVKNFLMQHWRTLLYFFSGCLILRYQYYLLSDREWGDESETIVTAKMMASGLKLYSEIFNHHGPLTFLPGLLLEKLGSFKIQGHRVIIVVLQWLTFISINTSPALRGKPYRNFYTVLAAMLTVFLMPDMFGHMYKYQTIVGMLLTITLAQYVLPLILESHSATKAQIILGNGILACLPFFAITYAPASVLLFLGALRKNNWRLASGAYAATILGNLIHLSLVGSVAGFFAFHLYMNLKVVPEFMGSPDTHLFGKLLRTPFEVFLEHKLLFLIFLASQVVLFKKTHLEGKLRGLALCAAIFSLLVRGSFFHALPYFYIFLVLPIIILHFIDVHNWRPVRVLFYLIFLASMIKLSLIIPADWRRFEAKQLPSTTEFSELVKKITDPNDRIIAYSFRPIVEYIYSDRLPASGYFFYLPWQAVYNEKPILNVKIDPCQQINDYRPKIILLDRWKVWDKFPWETYGGCIDKLLGAEYTKIPNKNYYVRRDIYQSNIVLFK